VDADYSVELGPDDAALEIPWSSPDDLVRYHDLKRHPELIDQLPEVHAAPELRDFLLALNSSQTSFETAKCDTWFSDDVETGEEIYGSCKFSSYVDILFSSDAQRFSFPAHESLSRHLAELLAQAPEIPASAEFIIRRCYYGEAAGFYISFYLAGFAEDEASARGAWATALHYSHESLTSLSA
jgi:hypothetical protein